MAGASSSLRALGRVLRNRALNTVDCRPVLGRLAGRGRSRSEVAKSIRTIFEALEGRQLMSVIPAPTVIDHPGVLNNGVRDAGSQVSMPTNNDIDASSPVIAVDPTNPNHLVAAYTTVGDPNSITNQTMYVHVAYSNNGGQSWQSLGISGNIDDPSVTTANTVYQLASDPSVSFDRSGNFYLVYNQHSTDYARGAIVLYQWKFTGNAPSTTNMTRNQVIYQWNGADAAISPTFVVDNNLPTYIDPDTGDTINDPTAGYLYVAWSTNLTNATDTRTATGHQYQVQNFNANAIMMMVANPLNNITVSGVSQPRFSNPFYVNQNQYVGVERNAHPRLVVSQGDVAGNVTPGQVTVVWDDWRTEGPGRVSQVNNQYDRIISTAVLPGTTATVEDTAANVVIDDTIAGTSLTANASLGATTIQVSSIANVTPGMLVFVAGDPNPHTVVSTASGGTPVVNTITFTGGLSRAINSGAAVTFAVQTVVPIAVNITDPSFSSLAQLTVSLAIGGAVDLSQYRIDLTDPSGTRTVTLFYNRPTGSTTRGITGNAMGVLNNTNLYTTFDDNAVRPIDDGSATAPFIGSFQVEQSQALPGTPVTLASIFGGMLPADINGTWTLTITDFGNGPNPGTNQDPATLYGWKLGFTTGSSVAGDRLVTRTAVLGQSSATSPDNYTRGTAIAPTGIGAGAVVAADNTLGSFSPRQGYLYVAFTDWGRQMRGTGHMNRNTSNPADNTDVYLMVSTDGGATWGAIEDGVFVANHSTRINDDDALKDGFSEGQSSFDPVTGSEVLPNSGRAQFMPTIAVDQTTGTVAVSFRDARNDASRSRVATYFAASIDGGASWSQNTYLNAPNAVTDATNLQTVNLGPIPDNLSAGAAVRETSLGYGHSMGLAVAGGHVVAVWSGNLNGGDFNANWNLGILSAVTDITAGPRIISSTMGQVGLPGDALNPSANGTPVLSYFELEFDRPVDKDSFILSGGGQNVRLVYRAPGVAGDAAGSDVPLSSIQALDGITVGLKTVATRFRIVLATPDTRIGTYSYYVDSTISDLIRKDPAVTYTYAQAAVSYTADLPAPLPVPSVGTGGAGTSDDVTTNVIKIAGFPDTQTIKSLTVRLRLDHTSDSDLTIKLTSPAGTEVVLVNPGNASGRNFGIGTGTAITYTIFDDSAIATVGGSTGPYVGSGKPDNALSAFAGESLVGDWTLTIEDNNGATPPDGDSGLLYNWGIDFTTAITAPSAGNLMDQDADGTPGERAISGHTTLPAKINPSATFGDMYATPMPTLATAWDGSQFHTPYTTNTLPMIIAGPHVMTGRTYDAQGPNTLVPIADAAATPFTPGVTSSFITIGGDTDAVITKLRVGLTISHPSVQSLTITLTNVATGKKVVLVQNRPNSFADYADFTGTVFDDSAAKSIASGTAPFNGSFRPEEALSAFNGDKLAGTWKLEITDNTPGHNGVSPELVTWSITADSTPVAQNGGTDNIHITFDRDMDPATISGADVVRLVGPTGLVTGPFTITPDPNFDPNYPDPDPTHPRTYKVSFTKQTLSGSYSLVLAPTIASKDGDLIDSNLNAGLDALRGFSAFTVPMTYSTSTPVPVAANPGGTQVSVSTIDVTDSYTIQGITVRANVAFADDSKLTGYLISPSGQRVLLFDQVGGAHSNFSNTLFDDNATTSIVNGLGSFFGRYAPQGALTTLVGAENALGTWTLEITNHSTTGMTGSIASWSLNFEKAQTGTGIGDPVADQTTIPFKVFNLGLNTPGSTTTWTNITSSGTVPNGSGLQSDANAVGRITSIATDPSDPSGNTVFVTTPSGGIWKTTNFLTTNPAGPTYVPLTDFGPAAGMHVASIALIPRNGDPSQTIVFALTGDPDMAKAGIGLLRSMDGGITWTLLDSKTNFDPVTGAQLTSAQRAHDFIGTVGYKVVADPTPTPTGEYILYVAMSGNGSTGGVYRSTDTGRTWTQVLAGSATDVILDTNSGPRDAFGNPSGNLQILYAGIAGQGLFLTANRGQSWTKLTPLGFDGSVRHTGTNPPGIEMDPASGAQDPNLNQGRIVLAMPNPTGTDAIADAYHAGWVYAAVVKTAPAGGNTRSGVVDGLYMTKDFGQNWTRVDLNRINDIRTYGFVPTNSQGASAGDFVVSSGPNTSEGNYALSLAVDPLNPNVVYFGGSGWGTQGGSSLVRVDTTGMSDAHAFFMRNDTDTNVFRTSANNKDTVTLANWTSQVIIQNPVDTPFINLVNNPGTGFSVGSTYYMGNVATVTNSGRGSKWIPLDDLLGLPITNGIYSPVHNVVTSIDPVTGKTRITVSTDTGIYTTVYDTNGQAATGVGNTATAIGGRGGDLGVNELIYGAMQPSVGAGLANEIAGALFYAMGTTTGLSWSDPNILTNGNTSWTFEQSPSGGTGVATDQTGSGNVYYSLDPYRGNAFTNFFLVNGIAQTTGLFVENNSGDRTQDSQWPDYFAPNFAVNPINGDQIVVSSAKGRIYATTNRGLTWFIIGEPDQTRLPSGANAVLDGTYAPAVAFGAPDPSATNLGNDATNLRVYVGTTGGHIYMTLDGGGIAANGWRSISAGLDGSAVQSIVADPTRGSRALYAVTKGGIYFLADSAVANPTWVKLNGNIASLSRDPFGNTDLTEKVLSQTTTGTGPTAVTTITGITSLVADWRYVLPGPNGTTFPVLYAAGDSGVFRSIDNGTTWTLFPTASDGATVEGGYLPTVKVTDLDLGIGNVNPTTGFTDVSTGPSVLLATTEGRGQFAIRVAPILVSPAFGANNGLGQRTVTGRSQASAYGNQVTIKIYDSATPDPAHLVGVGTTDSAGNFTVALTAPVTGLTVLVQATDDAGVAGPTATLALPPAAPAQPNLVDADDTGTPGDDLTSVRAPRIDNTGNLLAPGTAVTLTVTGVTNPAFVQTVTGTTDGTGKYTLTLPSLADGVYSVTVTQTINGLTSPASVALTLTIDATGPTGTGAAVAGQTSGTASGTITVATVTDPHGVASATINWGDGTTSAGTLVPTGAPNTYFVRGSHTYGSAGTFTIKVSATDSLGNVNATAAQTSVVVSLPAYSFTLTGQAFNPTEGSLFNGKVAIVNDGNLGHTAANLSATINWGDGTTSAGTIVAGSAGTFNVFGTHTYVDNRQDQPAYVVTVSVATTDGKTGTVGSIADVSNVLPSGTVSDPGSIYLGDSVNLTLTATDVSPADVAAGFEYIIDWGDGTTETVARTPGNGAGITRSHKFTSVSSLITVTISDKDKDRGGIRVITKPITVKTAPALNGQPVVNGDAGRSDISQITFNVTNTDIAGGLSLSNLKLFYNGDGVNAVSLAGAVLTFDPASGNGSLDLRNLTTSLREGDYQLQISVAGKLFVVSFFKLQGDVNGDGKVEAKDLALINKALGKSAGQPGYNAAADLNRDGVVNSADVTLYNKWKGRKATGGTASLLLQTGKVGTIPTLDFGSVAVNTNGGYIDLVIKNTNANLTELKIGKVSMGGAAFSFAFPGLPWGPASANTVLALPAGKSVAIRVYLKPLAKAQAVSGKLKFSFATKNSGDYKDVTVPVKATIVSAAAAVKAKAAKAKAVKAH